MHRDSSRVTVEEWQQQSDKSRVTAAAWQQQRDSSRMTAAEWHQQSDSSRVTLAVRQQQRDNSRVTAAETYVQWPCRAVQIVQPLYRQSTSIHLTTQTSKNKIVSYYITRSIEIRPKIRGNWYRIIKWKCPLGGARMFARGWTELQSIILVKYC